MRGERLLRYCSEPPARQPGGVSARGVVHAARPGEYVALCGAELEHLHLLGPTSSEGEPCPRCPG